MPDIRPIMNLTSFLRARLALRFIESYYDSHLDVGCGNGLMLMLSPVRVKVGVEKQNGRGMGDELYRFENQSFDFITILAVLEHIPGWRKLLPRSCGLLRSDGRIVMTIPESKADCLIRLFAESDAGEHEYITQSDICEFVNGCQLEATDTFELGFNRYYVFRKCGVAG